MARPEIAYAVWSWGLKKAGFSYFESVARTVALYRGDFGFQAKCARERN